MASEVVLVQGTNIMISENEVTSTSISPTPAMVSLDCIGREIQFQGGSADEIEVTSICSTAKEFRTGLEDPGTLTVNGHWVQTNEAHQVIRTAAIDKLTRLIEVRFNDGSVFRALGTVQQRSWSAAVSGVVTATYTFRLTGSTQEVDAT